VQQVRVHVIAAPSRNPASDEAGIKFSIEKFLLGNAIITAVYLLERL
jgi:hypothetical protein